MWLVGCGFRDHEIRGKRSPLSSMEDEMATETRDNGMIGDLPFGGIPASAHAGHKYLRWPFLPHLVMPPVQLRIHCLVERLLWGELYQLIRLNFHIDLHEMGLHYPHSLKLLL